MQLTTALRHHLSKLMLYEPVFGSCFILKLSVLKPKFPRRELPSSFSLPVGKKHRKSSNGRSKVQDRRKGKRMVSHQAAA